MALFKSEYDYRGIKPGLPNSTLCQQLVEAHNKEDTDGYVVFCEGNSAYLGDRWIPHHKGP